jgi:FkbM family methyltransferase
MKNLLRRLAQSLGIYYALGLAVARWQAKKKGMRLDRAADGVFCLTDPAGRKLFVGPKHAIYLSEFISYFDFYYDGVVPDENQEVHFEKPGWHTPRHWGKPLFFTSFAESEDVMNLYLEHSEIKPGAVIFDLGAYCGLTSLAFADKAGSAGHVYAFEPDPGNFAALKTNVDKYGADLVTPENLAIWKESGEIRFQAEGTVASSLQELSARNDATVAVQSMRLSDYIASRGITRLDLIKMDVEYAEVEILASSREVLRRFRPIVILEAHILRGVSTATACSALLREEGYQTYEVPQPGTKAPLLVGKPG